MIIWTTKDGKFYSTQRSKAIFINPSIYSFSEISSYIDQQFDDVLAEESRIKRNPRFTDNRVHALLYFIVATSHGLREQDIEFMKLMSTRVNVIPVISKADTLTVEELELNKKLVMQDIAYYNIPIYNFPMEDDADEEMDDEFIELNAYLRKTLPFAVIGASEMLNMSGKRMQVRRFPWGVVDVNDSKYSDVAALREVLTRTHLSDLKDNTHFVLYENYRTDKLSKDLPGTAAPTPNLDKNGYTSQFQQLAMPRTPFTGGGATLGDAESGTSSLLVREEQLRAEEEKLRMIELKVQNEIAQKRRELFAREQELKELEAKLKTDPDAMRFASPSLKQEMA